MAGTITELDQMKLDAMNDLDEAFAQGDHSAVDYYSRYITKIEDEIERFEAVDHFAKVHG